MRINPADITISAGANEAQWKLKSSEPRWNTCFHHVGYLLVAFGGLVIGTMLFIRMSISVSILSMVNRTHLYMVEHPNFTMEELETSVNREEDGHFNWSNERQQTIIGSYLVTYTLPQIWVGILSLKFGIRRSVALSMGLGGLSCLLLPVLVDLGWIWAVAMRMTMGLAGSGTITCILAFIENWLPERNRPLGLAIMQTTVTFILILNPLLTGILSAMDWKWGFYAPGLLGLLTGLAWHLLTRDHPSQSCLVSQKELDRIEDRGGKRNHQVKSMDYKEKKKVDAISLVPWYFMFKIKAFYPLLLVWVFYSITEASLIFLLPIYFKKAYQLSTKDNGMYMFLINVGLLVSMVWPAPVIAFLQNKLNMSLTSSRRVIVFIYCLISSLTPLYAAVYHDNQLLMFATFRLFHSTNELIIMATVMSQYGKHGLSGPVFGTINSIGMILVAVVNWALGKLLDYTGESYGCWSFIFGMVALMNALVFVFYLFLKSEPVKIKELEMNEKIKKVEI